MCCFSRAIPSNDTPGCLIHVVSFKVRQVFWTNVPPPCTLISLFIGSGKEADMYKIKSSTSFGLRCVRVFQWTSKNGQESRRKHSHGRYFQLPHCFVYLKLQRQAQTQNISVCIYGALYFLFSSGFDVWIKPFLSDVQTDVTQEPPSLSLKNS